MPDAVLVKANEADPGEMGQTSSNEGPGVVVEREAGPGNQTGVAPEIALVVGAVKERDGEEAVLARQRGEATEVRGHATDGVLCGVG